MRVRIYLTVIPGADRVYTSTVEPTGEWVQRIKSSHPGAKVYEAVVQLPSQDPPILDGRIAMRGGVKEL